MAERQISVDPISLHDPTPSSLGRPSFTLMTYPPPLLPSLPNFSAASLPSSASSSPRAASKKNPRNQSHTSPLGRSKSCGDGRASSAVYDEFDLPYVVKPRHYTSEDGPRNAADEEDKEKEFFKCSAFCLFLPGLGKGRPVRPRKAAAEEEEDGGNVASRAVSMERFECGSWASEGESVSLYFDLPMELMQGGANDASSPVRAAFVFDKHVKGVLKNVSTREAADRKSNESGRHVRFSVSSPTSVSSPGGARITPRLIKAREDFNAYLEAQSA